MMRKLLFACLVMTLLPCGLRAQTLNGMTDAQQLGAMAGLALACNAGNRLDDFQLIASYIIANESPTKAKRQAAFKAYAAEKLRTYNLQKEAPEEDCPAVLKKFYNLPIFGATVYKNGTVKFPDGKVLKAPSDEDKKRAAYREKKKAQELKRNYMIPSRSGVQPF